MITEHLIQKLHAMRLRGMVDSLQQQLDARECDALRFEERIDLMIQNEIAVRANVGLVKRVRWANIPIPEACIEDIDKHVPRELDPLTFEHGVRNGVAEKAPQRPDHRPDWNRQKLLKLRTCERRGPCRIQRALLPHVQTRRGTRQGPRLAAPLRPLEDTR